MGYPSAMGIGDGRKPERERQYRQPLTPFRDEELLPRGRSVPKELGKAWNKQEQRIAPKRFPPHAPSRPDPDSEGGLQQEANSVGEPCPFRLVEQEQRPSQDGCFEIRKFFGDHLEGAPQERADA